MRKLSLLALLSVFSLSLSAPLLANEGEHSANDGHGHVKAEGADKEKAGAAHKEVKKGKAAKKSSKAAEKAADKPADEAAKN